MADYSFVKDPEGQILGLWIRNSELTRTPIYIITLLKKHQGRLAEIRMPISDELIKMVLSQNYRVVANGFDQQGGCFVMFGQALAPGEENKANANRAPKPTCSKCGNVGMPEDKFCRKCGSPIKSEIHCKKCGNIVQPKDLFCVKCGSRLSRENEPEASFESLVAELIEIGKNTKSFNEGDTYYYRRKGEGVGLGEDWDARTREIGSELYRMGANKIQLMQEARNSVAKVLGPIAGRCLEAHWHEIGMEQWRQGKGECWLF